MFVFGGSKNSNENKPEMCEDSIAILNLDLHEWLPVGLISGILPKNIISKHSIIQGEGKTWENLWDFYRKFYQNLLERYIW